MATFDSISLLHCQTYGWINENKVKVENLQAFTISILSHLKAIYTKLVSHVVSIITHTMLPIIFLDSDRPTPNQMKYIC